MADTPTPLHYYDLGTGNFDETATYPFSGSTPTTYYFGPRGALSASRPMERTAGSDSVIWTPSGSPCGRPIDQWSMGGISIPSNQVGILAPCSDEDNTAQFGPWQTTYSTAPLPRAATLA